MNKTLLKLAAAAGASAMLLAGCAEPPSATTTPQTTTSVQPTNTQASDTPTSQDTASQTASTEAPAGDFKACMVSDDGGFDDKSFNETAHRGLTQAKDELKVQTAQVESNSESDYAPNLQAMIDAKCDIIVTVGYKLATATEAAAKQNPNIKFAIVDYGSFEGLTNAKGLEFNTAESSFMGGYLAAAMSQTGKVGTFGGAKYPTVTIFMDGFAQGVAYYNQVKGKTVAVLGWDAAKQDGQFVPGDKPFNNVTGAKDTSNTLIAQGADVLFPVAGPAGEGALQAAQASGGKVNAIWVDTDGCVSAAAYCPSLISSVYKAMDLAVFEAIKAAKDGTFSSDPYVGTLADEGTGLAPFHEFDGKVSAETKAELDQIKADIVSGKIKIESASQPK